MHPHLGLLTPSQYAKNQGEPDSDSIPYTGH